MGNREALLAGAKRCLYEKGYARTTARDIAAAAGTSLAAIGYHFRSTEALMNAALFEAMDEWGQEVRGKLTAGIDPDAGALERFETYWTRLYESFAEQREMLAATFEVLAQMDRVPELRPVLAEGIEDGRRMWAAVLQGIDVDEDPAAAHAVGSFYQALFSGLLVQWMIDPERAPTPRQLVEGLRIVATGLS